MGLFHFQSPLFEQIYVSENCRRAIDKTAILNSFKYEIEGKGKSVRGITKMNVDLSTFCTSPPNIQTLQTLQKSVTRFCVITFEPIKI